jgi:hypothetical protein
MINRWCIKNDMLTLAQSAVHSCVTRMTSIVTDIKVIARPNRSKMQFDKVPFLFCRPSSSGTIWHKFGVRSGLAMQREW